MYIIELPTIISYLIGNQQCKIKQMMPVFLEIYVFWARFLQVRSTTKHLECKNIKTDFRVKQIGLIILAIIIKLSVGLGIIHFWLLNDNVWWAFLMKLNPEKRSRRTKYTVVCSFWFHFGCGKYINRQYIAVLFTWLVLHFFINLFSPNSVSNYCRNAYLVQQNSSFRLVLYDN